MSDVRCLRLHDIVLRDAFYWLSWVGTVAECKNCLKQWRLTYREWSRVYEWVEVEEANEH